MVIPSRMSGRFAKAKSGRCPRFGLRICTKESHMAQGLQITITGGPSKWDLSIALFDSQKVNPRTVEFKTNAGASFLASLSSVLREDGSGESFEIRAYVRPYTTRGAIPAPGQEAVIYYRTDMRTGNIRFLVPSAP